MKLFKTLLPVAVVALAAATISCSKKPAETEAAEIPAPYSVDSLMSCAPNLVGDTVTVEGLCAHLCKHGGTKAFLAGSDSTTILLCQATASMGGAFAPDCPGKDLTITGVVCEFRPVEEDSTAVAGHHADNDSTAHEACETGRKAAKAVYYLEALSYAVPVE